ncbi:phage minor head protein [Tropicibacter sp. S64]|uniref:phage head morphogenesis protein n=1 Tax=Tropicibacter sp. S64 TaxID=3415122 RepID=UPI003C7CCC01
MADELALTFRRPFAEQIAAWRLRMGNLIPTARWDDIWKGQHDRGLMVAGAMKADLLNDLAEAIDKFIVGGQSLDEFRRDFRKIVEERGWHGWTGETSSAGQAWRTRVIYRTNMRTTYMAGRHAQLVAGNFKYWVYRHGGSVEPRIEHLGWDGLILEPDHPFWATHFPPNGWGCSCYVVGARSMRSAIRRGGKADLKLPPDWRDLDGKTGEPGGIDRGWGYAPGASVVQDINRIAQQKSEVLPDLLGEALARWAADLIAGDGPAVPPIPGGTG